MTVSDKIQLFIATVGALWVLMHHLIYKPIEDLKTALEKFGEAVKRLELSHSTSIATIEEKVQTLKAETSNLFDRVHKLETNKGCAT